MSGKIVGHVRGMSWNGLVFPGDSWEHVQQSLHTAFDQESDIRVKMSNSGVQTPEATAKKKD